MFVMIVSSSPRVAVMPSSRTMSIFICRITRKPSASVARAMMPGVSRFWRAVPEALVPSAPLRVSIFHALVICTAWLTAMEKRRKGTRMDMGSMP